MLVNYRIQSRPTGAPIDLDEVKTHLRLFDDDSVSDDYLSELIAVSVDIVSTYLGRGVGDHEYQAFYTNFEDSLTLPHDRVQSITSVQYYNEDNVLTIVAPANYFLDDTASIPAVTFNDAFDFPTLNGKREAPVVVTYDAGNSDAENGPAIQQALLIVCGDLYESQSSTVRGTISTTTELSYQRLLFPYKRIAV